MKCTFIITITLACLCNYINGQGGFGVAGTTAPPMYNGGGGAGGVGYGGGAGGAGRGAGGFGVNNQGQPDYGFGSTIMPKPTYQPTYQPGSNDDSNEDSTTMNPNGIGDGANAQQSMSGGGQFALGFVAVLLVVGCAVVLVFLVRRKRAQAMRDQGAPVTSA